MTNVLSEKKRLSLAALYHRMPIEELEDRIAKGMLAAPTMAIAQEVLNSRLEHVDPAPEPTSSSNRGGDQGSVVGTAMLKILAAGLSWLVLPEHMAALVTMVAVCWVVAGLGKALPRLGLTIGIVFAIVPVGLLLWAWQTGALVMRGGDYKPLGAMLTWLVLVVAFGLFWSLASLLIFGSRHKGSWRHLHGELDNVSDEQADTVRGRR
ncbi:hypothetical protein [Acidovorax kalamii]|nr:hypothetical protein [Acidovorax kalamii]